MLKIIAAHDNEFLIGNKNKLPWNIKEDIEHFHKEIEGKVILMGRITYESIKNIKNNFKVKKIIVMTKNLNYDPKDSDILIFHKIIDVLQYSEKEDIYICGGSEIYEQLLPYTKEMIITEIKGIYEGDSYFPLYDNKEFKLIKEKKLSDQAIVKYLSRIKKK
ncbi:/ folA / Dihydrofolate reductase /:122842 Forward [Candidatus Hepatoplasma crinochetorum]|uniref:dihydrofolate reductase n=1 Tax=Candidatus Hepatoplasma crinochetorum TaxID=295596 RepID=A0A0G7ZNF8_9MOLU|nr:/ folA / Dihydrofolate reductase /:122842 Forward [Candidatus Hepatoplasma crinochetorum]